MAFRHVSSRHFLALMEKHAGIGSWSLDVASGAFEWSDGLHRIMRTDPAKFTPSVDAVVDMVDADDRWVFLDKLRDGSALDARPIRMTLPDGSRRWQVCFKDQAPSGDDGAAVMIGIVQDVTEQKNAVDVLLQRQRLLETLVTLGGGMLWRAEPGGSLFFEIGWCEFTGTTLAANRDGGWLERLHPDDRDGAQMAWQTAVRTRTFYSTAYRVRRFDGTYESVVAKASPMLDAHGAVLEWVGYCEPIRVATAKRPEVSRSNEDHPTAVESKAARALLDWSIADLAQASGVSSATITRFESDRAGRPRTRTRTQECLLEAFADHGIEFGQGDEGVTTIRFKP